MKIVKYVVAASAICSSLIVSSCDEAIVKSTEDTSPTLLWQGVLPEEPDSAKTNWVYFDSKDEVTLIYNRENWDTLAVSGIDAIPINWLGPLNAFPLQKKNYTAFYHATERQSYICDGENWNLLNTSGKDGLGIKWLGKLPEAPTEPTLNSSYYDTKLKSSRIWNGSEWDDFSIDAINGISINWLGSSQGFPDSPLKNDAFYRSTEGITYIWDGSDWMVLSKDGVIGKTGDIIHWQGEFPAAPLTPLNNWAYYNSTDGNSYIYNSNREKWHLLAHAAKNGSAITWRGISDVEPDQPSINDIYRSTKDGNSYIFNGSGWELFCEGGVDGENGLNGLNIIWQGSFVSAPHPAERNWVYYNYIDKVSYCYDGSLWHPMLKSGIDGFEINWLGELYSDPINGAPEYGDVYYNKMDNMSYFYDGYDWVDFIQGGSKALDGKSIMWMGEHETEPYTIHNNSIYYNTKFGRTYIYNYGIWGHLISNGNDGLDAVQNNISSRQIVKPMDSIIITQYFPEGVIVPTGEYVGSDSMLHSVETPNPDWIGHLDINETREIFNTDTLYTGKLKRRNNGSLIQIFADANGGKFLEIDSLGNINSETLFTDKKALSLSSIELGDGTLLFSYIDDLGVPYITKVTPDAEIFTSAVSSDITALDLQMVLRSDGTPFLVYRERYYNYCITLDVATMTFSAPFTINNLGQSVKLCAINDGTVAVASVKDGLFFQIIGDKEIIREFTVGKFDAIDITDINQTKIGALVIAYNRKHSVSYVGKKTVSLLSMITPDGTEHKSYKLIDAPVYDISTSIDDNGFSLLFKSDEGVSYFQSYDGGLEQIFSYPLTKSVNQPSLLKLGNDEYIVTGAAMDYKGLTFSEIQRKNDNIGIVMKQLSESQFCLINNTGSHIDLKLTLCRYTDKGN